MITLAASLSVSLGVLAAPAPPAPAPAADPPPVKRDLLAGPQVEDKETAGGPSTLVKQAFDGKLEEVGPEPDYLAIGMLDLTPEQRAKFQTLRSARLTQFDQLVRGNYGLITELAALQGDNDPQKALKLFADAREAFAEYIERGSFIDEFAPELTPAQLAEARRMVREYWTAKAADMRRTMSQDAGAAALATRARLEAFGQMVKDSVERQIGLEQETFERVIIELGLTAEQQGKTQAIFQPLAIKRFQGIEVTPAENAEALAAFNRILTPEQRQKARAIYLREARDAMKKATDKPTPPAGDTMEP